MRLRYSLILGHNDHNEPITMAHRLTKDTRNIKDVSKFNTACLHRVTAIQSTIGLHNYRGVYN